MPSLRTPLLPTPPPDGELGPYLSDALEAAKEAGGSGRLRLEVGPVHSLRTGTTHAGVSLWVERGTGSSESWQRVTATIYADSYAEVLGLLAASLDGSE